VWVFRSWGRVGTTIGSTKLEEFETEEEAIDQFQSLYEQKTGNSFHRRDDFQKLPGKYYPLEIDFGHESEEVKKLSIQKSTSKLPKPIQELICLLFDVDNMKKALLEFEVILDQQSLLLDLKKMPLGKLSKKQIEKAFSILGEAQRLLDEGGSMESIHPQILDCSNRFYTLIPHDCGLDSPPLLNDPELIKTKLEMLDSLLEIEVAFNLLKEGQEEEGVDPIDSHYKKLKTDIEVLEQSSEEFLMIQEYIQNTHATTHSMYSLEILEVFRMQRQGESKRFKPFKALHNRMLLWHGSRTTNYAGILSQGLRIAPPEAPVTGYMFGKGIYFADMVSKSANYCWTSQNNPIGLVLLSEVALGNMYERKHAESLKKPPKGKHSVKGIGRTHPDPSQNKVLSDGTIVPLGKGVSSGIDDTSLLYNEFIVYDVAQVNIKYLLKLNFKYKF
ncbi:unnamed protein product, partial [Darwinula stevensoni]